MTAILLTACSGSSAADIAVCQAYQGLVDAWPSSSDELDQFGSATEFWNAVSTAGEALVATAESADSDELQEASLEVGQWASTYYEDNRDSVIGQGFIPYYDENHTPGGGTISSNCEEIGTPITY